MFLSVVGRTVTDEAGAAGESGAISFKNGVPEGIRILIQAR